MRLPARRGLPPYLRPIPAAAPQATLTAASETRRASTVAGACNRLLAVRTSWPQEPSSWAWEPAWLRVRAQTAPDGGREPARSRRSTGPPHTPASASDRQVAKLLLPSAGGVLKRRNVLVLQSFQGAAQPLLDARRLTSRSALHLLLPPQQISGEVGLLLAELRRVEQIPPVQRLGQRFRLL